jgi:hypothetical protein
VHYRIYGNGPHLSLFQALSNHANLPVYTAHVSYVPEEAPSGPLLLAVSPTRHNNCFLKQPIWSDHEIGMTATQQLALVVHANPVAEPR